MPPGLSEKQVPFSDAIPVVFNLTIASDITTNPWKRVSETHTATLSNRVDMLSPNPDGSQWRWITNDFWVTNSVYRETATVMSNFFLSVTSNGVPILRSNMLSVPLRQEGRTLTNTQASRPTNLQFGISWTGRRRH